MENKEGWADDVTSHGRTHYYKNGISLCGKAIQKKHQQNFDKDRYASKYFKDCCICIKKKAEIN